MAREEEEHMQGELASTIQWMNGVTAGMKEAEAARGLDLLG